MISFRLQIKEYPERTQQADLIHNIDLIESFDKKQIQTNSELVSSINLLSMIS